MSYTPTPWELRGTNVYLPEAIGGFSLHNTPNGEANAAFIVTAVNSHAALVEALKGMVQRFELYAGENDIHAGRHDKALLDQARAALQSITEAKP